MNDKITTVVTHYVLRSYSIIHLLYKVSHALEDLGKLQKREESHTICKESDVENDSSSPIIDRFYTNEDPKD